jgi:hypothetical protein
MAAINPPKKLEPGLWFVRMVWTTSHNKTKDLKARSYAQILYGTTQIAVTVTPLTEKNEQNMSASVRLVADNKQPHVYHHMDPPWTHEIAFAEGNEFTFSVLEVIDGEQKVCSPDETFVMLREALIQK